MGDLYVGAAVGKSIGQFAGMLQLNETCYTLILPLINAGEGEEVTREQLIANALKEYDTDEATISEYIDQIIEQLKQEGLLA